MSPSQNLCFQIFWLNPYQFLPQSFCWSLHLNSNETLLTVIYSRSDLKFLHLSLWNPLVRALAWLDNKLNIDLTLSMNFTVRVIDSPFSFSFLISTKKVMYFLVFSPENSTTLQILLQTLILNQQLYLESLWKITGICLVFCILNSRYYVHYCYIFLFQDSDQKL